MSPLRSFCFILLLCLAVPLISLAQGESYDLLTLKSGAIYKGQIAEYLPGQSLTMLLLDGRVMEFRGEEIESLREAGEELFEMKKRGYFNRSSLGLRLRMQAVNEEGVLSLHTVNGINLGRSQVGLGLGLEPLLNSYFIPTYLDYSYSFNERALSPVVGAMLGYAFNPNPTEEYDYWYARPEYKSGFTAGIQAGFRYYFQRNFGISFALDYRYYHLSTLAYDRYLTAESSYPVTGIAELGRFNLRLGFLFN